MARQPKRWILAVLLAVLAPALAIHVSCVAVMGPGSWGSGMEEKAPLFLAVEPGFAVSQYVQEFSDAATEGRAESSAAPLIPESLRASVEGTVFWSDELPSENLRIIASHSGPTWVAQQHFYLSREKQLDATAEEREEPAGQGIREVDLPSEMILERPALMLRHGATVLVIGRWQPWAIAPAQKLSRYLRSYADPTLRPEHSLYLYPLPSGPLEYWGPGHTLKPAPDRRKAILLRSGALGAGYYSMHLWDFEQDRLTTIVSLRESDPGSGRSFEYQWSRDSRAVHITGETGGFERRSRQTRSLDLIYLIEEDGLYDPRKTDE